MNWYLEVLQKYAVFSGRARRKEYWLFFLFNILISMGLFVIEILAGVGSKLLGVGVSLMGLLYALAVLVPGLAVTVRRLHDTGRSGWWLLMAFIPLIGTIVLIVFLATDGKPGANRYGPNPKETPGPAAGATPAMGSAPA